MKNFSQTLKIICRRIDKQNETKSGLKIKKKRYKKNLMSILYGTQIRTNISFLEITYLHFSVPRIYCLYTDIYCLRILKFLRLFEYRFTFMIATL